MAHMAALAGEVEQAFLVNRSVHDLLPHASGCGLSSSCIEGAPTHAWVQYHQSLLVWRVEDGHMATVRRLQLPQPAPEGLVGVEVIARAATAAVTVVAASRAGWVAVWLDANQLGQPLVHELPAPGAPSVPSTPRTPTPGQQNLSAGAGGGAEAAGVAALAAAPADAGAASGALVAVATTDGSLHLLLAGSKGLFPRTFFRGGGGGSAGRAAAAAPTAAGTPGAAPAAAGLWGALGSALSSAYAEAFDPLHRVSRRGASVLPSRQLQLLPASGAATSGGATGGWRLLNLTGEALDCWSITLGKRSGEELVGSWQGGYSSALVMQDELQQRPVAGAGAHCPPPSLCPLTPALSHPDGAASRYGASACLECCRRSSRSGRCSRSRLA